MASDGTAVPVPLDRPTRSTIRRRFGKSSPDCEACLAQRLVQRSSRRLEPLGQDVNRHLVERERDDDKALMSVTRLASTSRAQESCAAICAPTSSSPCAPAGKARPSDSAGAAGPARHEAGPGRPPRTGQLGGPLSDSVHSNWPDRVRSSPARRPSFGERDRREGPRLVAVGARTTRKLRPRGAKKHRPQAIPSVRTSPARSRAP
jgi:hypothetical protein